MLRHPVSFTFLGFYLNSLVDKGETLPVEVMKQKLASKTLLRTLEEKYGLGFDISIFPDADIIKIEKYFESCYEAINEERKFGVANNGLCFLIAYCFEAAQRAEKDVIFD